MKEKEDYILEDKFTLSNEVEIPKLGLGTWMMADKDAGPMEPPALRFPFESTTRTFFSSSLLFLFWRLKDGFLNRKKKRYETAKTTINSINWKSPSDFTSPEWPSIVECFV